MTFAQKCGARMLTILLIWAAVELLAVLVRGWRTAFTGTVAISQSPGNLRPPRESTRPSAHGPRTAVRRPRDGHGPTPRADVRAGPSPRLPDVAGSTVAIKWVYCPIS